jgi:hypothetical protein
MHYRLLGSVFVAVVMLTHAASLSGAYAATKPCKTLMAYCLAKNQDHPERCQVLYKAALKEGGVWQSPAARAAAGQPSGPSAACHTD